MGKYVRYRDIVVGDGNLPVKGHRVQIAYKLKLPTGEVLDSTNEESARVSIAPSRVGSLFPLQRSHAHRRRPRDHRGSRDGIRGEGKYRQRYPTGRGVQCGGFPLGKQLTIVC